MGGRTWTTPGNTWRGTREVIGMLSSVGGNLQELRIFTYSVNQWQLAYIIDNIGHYKKKVVGLERGPLSLVSTTEELLDRKV
jgi:hypothetical protein